MRKSGFSQEQIIAVLAEQKRGLSTVEVCRRHGISQTAFYKWKAIYGPSPVCKCFGVMGASVCINLSGLFMERFMLLAMMGSARPRPV